MVFPIFSAFRFGKFAFANELRFKAFTSFKYNISNCSKLTFSKTLISNCMELKKEKLS